MCVRMRRSLFPGQALRPPKHPGPSQTGNSYCGPVGPEDLPECSTAVTSSPQCMLNFLPVRGLRGRRICFDTQVDMQEGWAHRP